MVYITKKLIGLEAKKGFVKHKSLFFERTIYFNIVLSFTGFSCSPNFTIIELSLFLAMKKALVEPTFNNSPKLIRIKSYYFKILKIIK